MAILVMFIIRVVNITVIVIVVAVLIIVISMLIAIMVSEFVVIMPTVLVAIRALLVVVVVVVVAVVAISARIHMPQVPFRAECERKGKRRRLAAGKIRGLGFRAAAFVCLDLSREWGNGSLIVVPM